MAVDLFLHRPSSEMVAFEDEGKETSTRFASR